MKVTFKTWRKNEKNIRAQVDALENSSKLKNKMENHDAKQPETENYILLLKNYLNLEQKLAIIDEAKSRSNRKTAKNMVG